MCVKCPAQVRGRAIDMLLGGVALERNKKLKRLVLAALFAALSCVSTLIIQIPSPMQGYVNLGDCFVLLGAYALGPIWGGAAGGIGSMLADLLAGYAHYAPGTLVIKALSALVAALIFKTQKSRRSVLPVILGGLAGETVMVAGYFGYACLLLGKGLAAATSIPGNLVQAAVGIIASTVMIHLIGRSPKLYQYLER